MVGGEGDDQLWGSGRGAIAGCHCSVLWLGASVTTNFGGVDVVHGHPAQQWHPEKKNPEKLPWASCRRYTVLIIDNTEIEKMFFAIWVYAGIIFQKAIFWCIIFLKKNLTNTTANSTQNSSDLQTLVLFFVDCRCFSFSKGVFFCIKISCAWSSSTKVPIDGSTTVSQPFASAICRNITATSSTLLWTWNWCFMKHVMKKCPKTNLIFQKERLSNSLGQKCLSRHQNASYSS